MYNVNVKKFLEFVTKFLQPTARLTINQVITVIEFDNKIEIEQNFLERFNILLS